MTEEVWLADNSKDDYPRNMLWLLSELFPPLTSPAGTLLDRKWRLFGCAAIRRISSLLFAPELQTSVVAAEEYADDRRSREELVEIVGRAASLSLPGESRHGINQDPLVGAYWYAQRAVGWFDQDNFAEVTVPFVEDIFGATVNDPHNLEEEGTYQRALLRDIFGNPFQPVTLPKKWRTEHTSGLAAKMYDDRDFAAMPILADAMEEAGCDNQDILTHCREPGVHVRGCWVVDLVLGKS